MTRTFAAAIFALLTVAALAQRKRRRPTPTFDSRSFRTHEEVKRLMPNIFAV